MGMRFRGHLVALLVLSITSLSGCFVTIPNEAPILSAELGKRINELEASNITLLHKYFEFKREQVDEFVSDVWLPAFAANVMEDEETRKHWSAIVKSNDPQMAFEFILDVGPQLQAAINEKHQELVKPLNDLEREIEKRIREEFNQARAINNTLTSFLSSAAEVAENRQKYLDMIGVSEDKISDALRETDEAVSTLLDAGKTTESAIENVVNYKDTLKGILKSVTG